MYSFEKFRKLHEEHIRCDDLNILNEFYHCIINGNKYSQMIAFVYQDKNSVYYNIMSDFIDIIGEKYVNDINNFKLYNSRPYLIIIPESCKGKNKKLNENIRNLLFYEQPLLYRGSFIKGVFNNDILDKTHIIYI